jgi:hypothetical protein
MNRFQLRVQKALRHAGVLLCAVDTLASRVAEEAASRIFPQSPDAITSTLERISDRRAKIQEAANSLQLNANSRCRCRTATQR